MSPGVIANCVAVGEHLLDQFRVPFHIATQGKECGWGLVTVKDFQNLRRVNGVRAVVKGQGHGSISNCSSPDGLSQGRDQEPGETQGRAASIGQGLKT
jgi:hypothetical protein